MRKNKLYLDRDPCKTHRPMENRVKLQRAHLAADRSLGRRTLDRHWWIARRRQRQLLAECLRRVHFRFAVRVSLDDARTRSRRPRSRGSLAPRFPRPRRECRARARSSLCERGAARRRRHRRFEHEVTRRSRRRAVVPSRDASSPFPHRRGRPDRRSSWAPRDARWRRAECTTRCRPDTRGTYVPRVVNIARRRSRVVSTYVCNPCEGFFFLRDTVFFFHVSLLSRLTRIEVISYKWIIHDVLDLW